MVRLYLVRHAQAAGAEPGARDHARPLDADGWDAASRIGRALAARRAAPALVLCSSAVRARETWEALAGELPPAALSVEAGLYLATPANLLERLAALAPEHEAVLLVGHNPGLHQLACLLVGAGEAAAPAALERGFPAGAAAALECEDGWVGIGPGRCRLDWLLLPEALV